MKQTILSFIIIACLSVSSYGQLSLQDTSGHVLANGDTVLVYGEIYNTLSDHFYINNSLVPLVVGINCFPTAIAVANCQYTICVGITCLANVPDNTNYASSSFTTPKGKNPNALFTEYVAMSEGTTIIRYDVVTQSATDSAWIFVKFIVNPTGVPIISSKSVQVSSLYPNPANSILSFTYHTDFDAQLRIYNSLGQLVKTWLLSPSTGTMNIPIDDLPSGIFTCSFQASGMAPSSRKLVVSH